MIPSEDPLEDNTTLVHWRSCHIFTGSDRTPPWVFLSNEPEIRFEVDHTRRPTASTCGPTLHLPITLIDPDMFEEKNGCSINWCTWIWFSLAN